MSSIFVDRESAYPNRYRVIPESGDAYYVIMERADEAVTPGTPLNAETFNRMRDEIDAEIGSITPAKIGAAPAGYGLGGKAPYKLYNDATECGFYNFWIEPSDGYKGYATFETISSDQYPLIVQKFTRSDAVNMQRVGLNGAWGELEYENPPMVPGVEYRTTERWNGSPVYAQLVDFVTVPANNYKSMTLYNVGNARVIDLRGYMGTSYIPRWTRNPAWGNNPTTLYAINVEGSISVTIYSESGYDEPAVVLVKYIKL